MILHEINIISILVSCIRNKLLKSCVIWLSLMYGIHTDDNLTIVVIVIARYVNEEGITF